MTNYRNDQEKNFNTQTRAGIIRREQKLSIALPSMYNTLIKMHADNTVRVNAAGAAALANRQETIYSQKTQQPEAPSVSPIETKGQADQVAEPTANKADFHEFEIPKDNAVTAEIYNQDEATQLRLEALAKIAAIHREAEGGSYEPAA